MTLLHRHLREPFNREQLELFSRVGERLQDNTWYEEYLRARPEMDVPDDPWHSAHGRRDRWHEAMHWRTVAAILMGTAVFGTIIGLLLPT